jgi:hypothetical protein
MKYFASAFLIVVISFLGRSQTYEIGALIGGTNFIGDVGKTSFIAPKSLGYGVIAKWNRSPRHAFRISVINANIEGNDADSNESRRRERGYSFTNNVTEFSGGIEYTFWEYNVYNGRPVSTPYLYTGLTYILYKAAYINPTSKDFKDYDQAGTIAIPMVLGYKAKLSTEFAISFEIGARYTFTDDLDGSNPVKGLSNSENLKFGNVNNNDWYVFTGVNLNFTFGRKPCYCNF